MPSSRVTKTRVVQDVVIHTDNVLYHKEKYYSPSERRTYLAALPPGYDGQFGPGIKALALVQYFACNMAEPKILEFFANVGIQLSAGELSNWLIKDWPELHAEKAAIYEAGLRSSPWQHLDDTATRVNGQNEHCHVVCNPLYTAYFTTAHKDRLTIVDVLRNLGARTFRVNAEAIDLLRIFGLAQCTVRTRAGPAARPGLAVKPSSPPCWTPGCRPWGRSNARASWKPRPWPPTMPSWSSRSSSCCSAMTPRSSTG